jgi:hypothetical protein
VKWLIVTVAVLLAGCSAWWVEDTYDPVFDIPAIIVTDVTDVLLLVTDRILYVNDTIHDKDEYWQSPDQTWTWQTGDCEDFVILAMYFLHREFGGWPELAGGWYDDGVTSGYHGWLMYEGRQYEPQTGMDVTDDPAYRLQRTISYGETMWRAEYWHRALDNESGR